jgi:rhodanese-related sulfurtransferase
VALIVVAGGVLGLLHNGMGLASRPPRGIPWLASPAAVRSLESLTPPESTSVAPAEAGAGPAEGAGAGPPASTVSPAAGSPTRSEAPPTPATTRPSTAERAAAAPAPPAGASVAPETRPSVPLPFIPTTDQPIQVELSTAKRFFDARGALFLDARDPAEFEEGHIPGAVRLTNAEAQNDPGRVKALDVRGRPIIAYCEGGACEASLELARTLIEAGYRKVLVFTGGYPEWSAAGYAVERGSGTR